MFERKEEEGTLESTLISFLRNIFSLFSASSRFEDFIEETGKYFDERILLTEKQKNLEYIAGTITFTLSKNQVNMNVKLYFQNNNKKWIVQEASNSVEKSRFNDWDKNEDLLKLSRGETVELYIVHPDNSEV